MHGGFQNAAPQLPDEPVAAGEDSAPQPDEVMADVRRIDAMWADCRARFGQGGPFLFGAFGAADAMYAPVVARFYSYGIAGRRGRRALTWRR